jgi:hypothetical protein
VGWGVVRGPSGVVGDGGGPSGRGKGSSSFSWSGSSWAKTPPELITTQAANPQTKINPTSASFTGSLALSNITRINPPGITVVLRNIICRFVNFSQSCIRRSLYLNYTFSQIVI